MASSKEAAMPWKESCAMDERARFCQQAEDGDFSVAELCRAYEISRQTGYKWLDRYRDAGVAGLTDRSRARHTQSHEYPAKIRDLIVAARVKHPTWGAKKLRPWLAKKHPRLELPSLTTIESILRKANLVRERRRSRRLEGAVGVREGDDRVNGVWAVDFKGDFLQGDGRRCYPLTVTDSCSRYLLQCQALPSTGVEGTLKAFDTLFREYGVPERIRSDNGLPFASSGLARLSRVSVYWITLGIEVERTRPGKPQDNGRHERMHRTLAEETTRPPARTRVGQQRRFNRFRSEYNEERPHEALEMRCPGDLYEASDRPYEEQPYEYPGHHEVRRVSDAGQIYWRNEQISVTKSLAGQDVGLVEIDEGVWKVSFRMVPLGRLSSRRGRVQLEGVRPGRSGPPPRKCQPCA
jgi:transposase InsO family protein